MTMLRCVRGYNPISPLVITVREKGHRTGTSASFARSERIVESAHFFLYEPRGFQYRPSVFHDFQIAVSGGEHAQHTSGHRKCFDGYSLDHRGDIGIGNVFFVLFTDVV